MEDQKFQEKVEKEIKYYMKDHKAIYSAKEDMETLSWKKSGTSVFGIDYIMRGNILIVTGDLGHAIYRWSSPVMLEWVSRCDLSYFAEKCVASETGSGGKEWNAEIAKERFIKEVKIRINESDDEYATAPGGIYDHLLRDVGHWGQDVGGCGAAGEVAGV